MVDSLNKQEFTKWFRNEEEIDNFFLLKEKSLFVVLISWS